MEEEKGVITMKKIYFTLLDLIKLVSITFIGISNTTVVSLIFTKVFLKPQITVMLIGLIIILTILGFITFFSNKIRKHKEFIKLKIKKEKLPVD